jgi:HAD superfamily phosphatase (TIGR01668 family)
MKKIKAYSPLFKGKIKPDYNLESIYDIDPEELLKKGIKGIFFDLDSTITKSKSAHFTDKTRFFLETLSENFKFAIVSNNYKKIYIERVQAKIDIKIYYPAEKPQTGVIEKALNELDLKAHEVALVGDRPVTDILAGKNAGMLTILVDSIAKAEENLPTRLIRWVERLTVEKI